MALCFAPFALIFGAGQDDRLVALLAVVHAGAAQAVIFNPAFAVDEKIHFEFPLLAHAGHGFPPLDLLCFGVIFAVFLPCNPPWEQGQGDLPLRVDGPTGRGIFLENALFSLRRCSYARAFHTPAAGSGFAANLLPCFVPQSNPGPQQV